MKWFVHFFIHKGILKIFLLPLLSAGLCANFVIAQEIKITGKIHGQIGKNLDAYLTQLVDKGFSGAVLVARKGKVKLAKGYGFADREKQIPVTPETVLHLGSVNKQFTAAAILKLEMQGKLKVTDPITKYFKDVPPDKQQMTLHHLLSNSSGIPDRVGRCRAETTLGDFVQMALNSKLEFQPGAKYLYSSSGFELLGIIVELISGQPYEQYLGDNLFKSAGMKNTGEFIPNFISDRIALGYRNTGEKWGTMFDKILAIETLPAKQHNGREFCGRASGLMLSTVGDMYKWHRALEGERILSKTAKQKLFAPHVPENEKATRFYAYGWSLSTTARNTKLFAHNGSLNEIFQADFRRYIDEKVVIIIMTNSLSEAQSAISVSPQIAKIIFADSK